AGARARGVRSARRPRRFLRRPVAVAVRVVGRAAGDRVLRRKPDSIGLMTNDIYGLPVTTDSREALDAYQQGVDAALGWKASALERFQRAIAHDPGLAMAHAGAAACFFLEERFG